MRLAPRESRLIRVVAFLFAALITIRLIWLPMYQEKSQAGMRLEETRLLQQTVDRNLRMRASVERAFTAFEQHLRDQRSAEEEISAYLQTLNTMLSGMTLHVGGVRTLPSEVAPTFKKHTVQLEVSGELVEVGRLLLAIARSELPVRVERAECVGVGAGGRVQATLWVSQVILLGASPPVEDVLR